MNGLTDSNKIHTNSVVKMDLREIAWSGADWIDLIKDSD
jgi:hypothetical protein